MAGGGHDALAAMWREGREGTMSPWTQALALALKEAWADFHPETSHGRNAWIASKLHVQGSPRWHPTGQAIGKFLKKVECDPTW